MYFKRQSSCKDEEPIIILLKRLISANSIRASYKYGKYLIDRNQGNDYTEGLQCILNAANRGHVKSCYMIGNYLYNKNRLDDCFPYYYLYEVKLKKKKKKQLTLRFYFVFF